GFCGLAEGEAGLLLVGLIDRLREGEGVGEFFRVGLAALRLDAADDLELAGTGQRGQVRDVADAEDAGREQTHSRSGGVGLIGDVADRYVDGDGGLYPLAQGQ